MSKGNNEAEHPNRKVHAERFLGPRPSYGVSNTFSGIRQAEEDAQNATKYRPSEYDDYDYG